MTGKELREEIKGIISWQFSGVANLTKEAYLNSLEMIAEQVEQKVMDKLTSDDGLSPEIAFELWKQLNNYDDMPKESQAGIEDMWCDSAETILAIASAATRIERERNQKEIDDLKEESEARRKLLMIMTDKCVELRQQLKQEK